MLEQALQDGLHGQGYEHHRSVNGNSQGHGLPAHSFDLLEARLQPDRSHGHNHKEFGEGGDFRYHRFRQDASALYCNHQQEEQHEPGEYGGDVHLFCTMVPPAERASAWRG